MSIKCKMISRKDYLNTESNKKRGCLHTNSSEQDRENRRIGKYGCQRKTFSVI